MENDMMTVLLVQPGKHPVEITIPHTLKELQKQVGGTIEIVYPWPDRSVGLVCHDEGKLLGLPLNRALPEIGDAIIPKQHGHARNTTIHISKLSYIWNLFLHVNNPFHINCRT